MTKLNKKEMEVLKGLRDAVENTTNGWGTVYLDNVVAAVSERQFAGYLSALEKKGLYLAEKDDPCFGRVALTDTVEPSAEPKAKKAPKAKKSTKKIAAVASYGHRSLRTAALHTAFDTMSRKDALAYAINELGYTQGGASSWFADWSK